MLLLFSNESHTATLHSEYLAIACVVYDDQAIPSAKVQIIIVNRHLIIKKMYKNNILMDN